MRIHTPKPTLIYINVPDCPDHARLARRFIQAYKCHDPGHKHDLLIVANSLTVPLDKRLFDVGRRFGVYQHSDLGWDIGGFIAAARTLPKDTPIVCFGGPGYWPRAGWLDRLMETWHQHGPGLYGTLATFEVRPHINTTGFLCPAGDLAAYPFAVETKPHRYAFEHSASAAFWILMEKLKRPVKLVTWDQALDWVDWRTPKNCYRRGDQSNCLTWWTHTDNYFNADAAMKLYMARLADTLTDQQFARLHRQLRPVVYPKALPPDQELPKGSRYDSRLLGCVVCGQSFKGDWPGQVAPAYRPKCPECQSAAVMPIEDQSLVAV